MEKDIEKDFSQRWEIYRVATHELGGIHLVPLMSTVYTTKMLMDMLEIMDVHDSLKKMAIDKQKAAKKER